MRRPGWQRPRRAAIVIALAGALMQGLTRNPLADPGLLGVNSGAGLAVTLCILLGLQNLQEYVWFGFLGAGLAGFAVYALGSVGGATPLKLMLAGAIFSSVAGAFISAINLLDPGVASLSRFLLAGNIAGIGIPGLLGIAPFLGIGLLIALGSGKALNGLSLGDDVARSLGQRIALTRALITLSVVLLAGSAVSLAGRVVAEPGEIQAGIMIAIIGGPFFIAVARRRSLGSI